MLSLSWYKISKKKIVDLRPSGENKSLVCQRITNNMAILLAAAGCENFVFIFNSNFIITTTNTSNTTTTTTAITTD